MLHHKRMFVLLAIVLIATVVLSGCARGQALAKSINLNLGTEPPTIDPSLATDTTSNEIVEGLFMGLTDYDEKTVEVIPELASSWKVSDDGLTWTFTMRKDVQWVQYDPASKKSTKMGPVTAKDVVYGVKRTINPETASTYAYVDYIIKNAEAVNTGESKDLESVGVRAVDDYTVEFTLEQPAGYFPGIAGMWVNRPMPQQPIDASKDKWTDPGTIWTNGAYMLDTWEHESKMVLVKNPYYVDAKNVAIEQVNYAMVVEASTAFAMYENGELDVVAPPLSEMDRIKSDATLSKELVIGPSLCTYYYGFNTTKAPFTDVRVRQAFSMAIDRQKLIDTVTKGEQRPAKSFAPPGIFGGVADDPNFKGVSYDVAGAQKLLADAGFPGGQGLPEITLMINTSEGHQKIAEFIQRNWKENLGVNVIVANQEWKVYLTTLDQDAPQVYRNGWCADYPDENNWVSEVFHPTKSQNNPKWDPNSASAKAFMAATEKAAAAAKPEDRKTAYFEAEKILVEDQAIIAPIYYYTSVTVTRPYVERTYNPMSINHVAKWKVSAH